MYNKKRQNMPGKRCNAIYRKNYLLFNCTKMCRINIRSKNVRGKNIRTPVKYYISDKITILVLRVHCL